MLDEVISLGTKNSKTLGHFPKGAFQEHAKKGNIIGAFSNANDLLGYLLFSVTVSKRTIRVVHLCISQNHRNKGVAKLLVNELRDKFSTRLKGIVLSCREDYVEATKFWRTYGFKALNRIRSRSKKKHFLVIWWYDFGNHDLFSLSNTNSDKVKALLDANIIIKLRDKNSDEQTGAKYLMADWLVDEIDYYYAPEFFNEILRDKDTDRAAESRSFVTKFCEAKFNPVRRDDIFETVETIIVGRTENDISDKKQLSECIACDIEYFITTDINLLEAEEKIFEKFGVQILTPTDFILMLDQINNRSNYIATRIAGVNVQYRQLESKEINPLIDCFLRKKQGEKKHELRGILTSITGNVNGAKVKIIHDKEGVKLGFWCAEFKKNTLIITAIRTGDTKVSLILFKQLVFDLINYAIENHKSIIKIKDQFLGDSDKETLESLSFSLKKGIWTKIALTGITNSTAVLSDSRIPSKFLRSDSFRERLSKEPKTFAYSLERMFWPIKFTDLDIPTYIIPIKPLWSGQLFDFYRSRSNLFGAPPELAWNRENIYYRSVNPVSEKSPARILWYASSSTNRNNSSRSQSIVGCSYLDEVYIGPSKILFQKFKNFGIYEWKDVFRLAKNDIEKVIKALKFSDTEVFKNAVPLNEVNKILVDNNRKKNTFPSPLTIDNNIFLEIYKRGVSENYE
ncbi:GNAT family N-acetyltransferase [Maribacter arenosus]|uniref:GNAT family N-acetyltransferase n=1 Tax=Maribacter arenosus TaxID=1854708 RepID=A0ABR7VI99_9FLAO|nr:GNAT family N-acetyltransferase [Maribacter arenosus]MBD0851867.1 GNAT family N-acetyltransferase [Maribacter arenosus]